MAQPTLTRASSPRNGATAFWVPKEKLDRLPAAYRHGEGGLAEKEPARGGFYAGPPPFDVSHSELVSTARDYHRFLRMLVDPGGSTEPADLRIPSSTNDD